MFLITSFPSSGAICRKDREPDVGVVDEEWNGAPLNGAGEWLGGMTRSDCNGGMNGSGNGSSLRKHCFYHQR